MGLCLVGFCGEPWKGMEEMKERCSNSHKDTHGKHITKDLMEKSLISLEMKN